MYWYDTRPATPLADPAHLLARFQNHPLLQIGEPRTDCPATIEEANELNARYRATLAHLGIEQIPDTVALRSEREAQRRAEHDARFDAKQARLLATSTIGTDFSVGRPGVPEAGQRGIIRVRHQESRRGKSSARLHGHQGARATSYGNRRVPDRGDPASIGYSFLFAGRSPVAVDDHRIANLRFPITATGEEDIQVPLFTGEADEGVTARLVRGDPQVPDAYGTPLEELPELLAGRLCQIGTEQRHHLP
jgi:hypothetical protein